MKSRHLLLSVAVVALGFASVPARADTVSVQWFTVAPGTADFGSNQCCSTFFNEVNSALGPNGLPVLNNANGFPLAEAVGSELQWWNPSTLTSTNSNYTILANQNLFAPNGTGSNDSAGFQTAIFSGTLTVGPGGGSIVFGGDDDVFLALNGSIVSQVDGVHSSTDINPAVAVGQGVYSLILFYADRDQVDANLQFQLTNASISSAVPEPSTWAMMILGFCGVGLMAYRRKNTGPAACLT